MHALPRAPATCFACILIAAGCRPGTAPANGGTGTEAGPVPGADFAHIHPACTGPRNALADEICHLVPAWQDLDPSWMNESGVILITTLREFVYPCVFHDDGSSDMILGREFEILRVLKGQVEAPAVNISMALAGNAPPDFVGGRSYLVMMKAGDETLALLADPGTRWSLDTEPHSSEVVAIVDLSQSADEAMALHTVATRSGESDGFVFNPGAWEALRGSEDNDLGKQMRCLEFIAAVVLVEGTTLAQAREWLGEPDWWWMNEDGISHRWNLHRKVATAPEPGMIAVRLEAWFDAGLALVTWRADYSRCTKADGTSDAWIALEPQELAALGLAPMSGP